MMVAPEWSRPSTDRRNDQRPVRRPEDRRLHLILFIALASISIHAQDWRQFRGPTGQGIASGDGYPVEWSETKHIAWKTAVPGRGWSSPVIAHGRVWITTAVMDRRDASLRLLAFDIASGHPALDVELFRVRGAELLNAKNSHASPTPIVDSDRVYVHFGVEGTGGVALDGTIIWKTKQGCLTQHGSGGSPVTHDGLVILTCDGIDAAYLVALDGRTGRERWKTWRRQPWSQAYATPLLIRVGDVDQLVSPGAFYAASYDPATGREIWRVNYPDGFSNVPRPVYAHGLVFITTGFQQPALLAIRPDGKGDVTRTHVAWRLTRGVPHTSSPIVAGDHLFMVSDAGIASCVDARTGTVVWQERIGGGYSASPLLAGGLLYLSSEDGVTTVLRPDVVYRPVAINQLAAPILASAAVADRSLFIRTATHLYRISGTAGPCTTGTTAAC
jgi:outer membrane protein assembly factor BamB